MSKRVLSRVGLVCGVGCLALLAIPSAAAARKPITGKLSGPGYTVLALKASGKATSVRAKPLNFRLKPPAKVTTLELRNRNGTYGGPIVLATKKHGERAIAGVRAGAKLGPITVKSSKGYAKVKSRPPKRFLDSDLFARARHGVPIGAGNFGRVRSQHTHGGVPGDRDLDGIPNSLDIDDNGDLVLDSFDGAGLPKAGKSAATTLPTTALGSDLTLGLDQTANVDAGSTTDEIDAALSTYGQLAMVILPGDSAELDCGGSVNPSPPPPLLGGLSYCSYGGTGRLFNAPMPGFPECCDDDGDGFGTMVNAPGFTPPGTMILLHGADHTEIGTGDVLIERVTTAGEESQFAAALQFVFATVPALVSYSDTEGDSATVSYPVASNGPGTQGNGVAVKANSGGDVLLTVSLWRPQRARIDQDPGTGQWIDTGGLNYAVLAGSAGDCPQSSFSTADPNLTPVPPSMLHGGGFTDLAADQPANSANTLTYTLNATDCLASKGITWGSGETRQFAFFAYTGDTGQEGAMQPAFFKLQP
jgi:hypothetical protein